jgi:hypothetical protein
MLERKQAGSLFYILGRYQQTHEAIRVNMAHLIRAL